jgi:hypothetical protein
MQIADVQDGEVLKRRRQVLKCDIVSFDDNTVGVPGVRASRAR